MAPTLSVALGVAAMIICLLIFKVLRSVNFWLFELPLQQSQAPLPPGNLGWPLFGNMYSFWRAFKSENPQSFIGSYIERYGRLGVYKAHLFGQPTILAITPEACKFVLMNDDLFVTGWPKTAQALMGRKSFTSISPQEHKRLRRLTAAALNGQETFNQYLPRIEMLAIKTLAEWAERENVQLLVELRKFTFRIIADIFIGYKPGLKCDAVEREYTTLNHGIRAMPVNFPGTAYHKALKSRARVVNLLQEAVDERRALESGNKEDVLNALLVAVDEDGNHLTDEEIIDILVMYLNAGHESSAHTMMWILIFLNEHPQILEKVKKEQVEIRKRKRPNELLTLEDYREMRYLSKVIDETLRIVNISPMVFRKAVRDVEFDGYTIPKGWSVAAWMRQVHLDPVVYSEPMKFNPDRWDSVAPMKAGTFIPFGAGTRLCPGNDFAKLEMSVFMHHMIFNYRTEAIWPNAPITYLPHPRPKDNYAVRVYQVL